MTNLLCCRKPRKGIPQQPLSALLVLHLMIMVNIHALWDFKILVLLLIPLEWLLVQVNCISILTNNEQLLYVKCMSLVEHIVCAFAHAHVMIRVLVCNGISIIFGLIDQPIEMTPIENYLLDSFVVGETITIGCVIKSACGSSNIVKFINEQGETVQSFMRNVDGAFNWNPKVDSDLSGSYSCFAQNSLGNASQTFMITGM